MRVLLKVLGVIAVMIVLSVLTTELWYYVVAPDRSLAAVLSFITSCSIGWVGGSVIGDITYYR